MAKKYTIEFSPLEVSYLKSALQLALRSLAYDKDFLRKDYEADYKFSINYDKLLNFLNETEPSKIARDIIYKRNKRLEDRKKRDWLKLFEKKG